MQGNKRLIVYVITYGPKSTWSPLGDTGPPKGKPLLELGGIHALLWV